MKESLQTSRRPAPSRMRGPFPQLTPLGAPLDMPVQSLEVGPQAREASLSDPVLGWRRAAIFSATALMTLIGAGVMAALMEPGGFSMVEGAALAIFALLFAWIAFSFASAFAGFLIAWGSPRLDPGQPQPIIFTKTALLMPTYNEEPARILAAAQAIIEGLEAAGVAELFDTFILSDTRDEAIARAEVAGALRLQAQAGAAGRVFYRRREANIDRKAGNISQWVRTFGGAYESMIILDADSLMSADTIVRLTAAMERHPRVGLIQTLPLIVQAQTLFGRLQQFASRVYGPMIAQGQDWWSGAEGNYWGHNAIIRTRAFAEQAGLPHLKGARPFGGHILSHDFVEAALLRRGGWAVRMATALGGSYEETPPTLIDMAMRDRRWCQGNLQHSALLGARGLHWISRVHLARGVLSYLTAPLWFAFLAVGAVVWALQPPSAGASASPGAAALLALTFGLLLAPKALAGLLVLRDRQLVKASGGRRRFTVSVLAEMALSTLAAPTMMLMHSRAVFDVLCGRDSGWGTQQRDGGTASLAAAWRAHRWHMAIGLACAIAAFRLDPAFFWWTSPVTVGLVLSGVLSIATARIDAGLLARRLGLFITPEETAPPPVTARAAQLRTDYAIAPYAAQGLGGHGLSDAPAPAWTL